MKRLLRQVWQHFTNRFLHRFIHILPYEAVRYIRLTVLGQRQRVIVHRQSRILQTYIENQCIFIHIPKTAGLAVCQGLFDIKEVGHWRISHYRIVLSRQEFEGFFKFAVVRNPWDRLFSAFNFLKSGGYNELDRQWAKKHLALYSHFDDFVKGWVSRKSVFSYIHFKPQYFYINHPLFRKQIDLDFMGFYENLEADYNYIQQRIFGNQSRPLPQRNVTQAKEASDYKQAYSETARQIVADVYREDIELFGYCFDNSSLPEQIAKRGA